MFRILASSGHHGFGVHRQEFRRELYALENVDVDAIPFQLLFGQMKPDLCRTN